MISFNNIVYFIILLWKSVHLTQSQFDLSDACDCTVTSVPAGTSASTSTSCPGTVDSTNPEDLFQDMSVCFAGATAAGGQATTYEFTIICTNPCQISQITVDGRAFQNTQLLLYAEDAGGALLPVGKEEIFGDNGAGQSYNLSPDNFCGTMFRLIETNTAGNWRFRESITITTAISPCDTTPSPTTSLDVVALPGPCDCAVSLIQSATTSELGTYKSDAGFASSENPLDVWRGCGVFFEGTSTSTFQTYEYEINCAMPCWFSDITFVGSAFQNTQFKLWNDVTEELSVGKLFVHTGNVAGTTHTMNPTEFYGTTFRLTETNTATVWRFRELISLTQNSAATASPTPAFTNPVELNDECGCQVSVVEASLTYPTGDVRNRADGVTIASCSDDPLSPWRNISVHFVGNNPASNANCVNHGIASNPLGNKVYEYSICCDIPCYIDNIQFVGSAFNSDITLYNEDKTEILAQHAQKSAPQNNPYDFIIDLQTERYESKFILEEIETGALNCWRQRQLIQLSTMRIPTMDPTTNPTQSPTMYTTNPTMYTTNPTMYTTNPTQSPTESSDSDDDSSSSNSNSGSSSDDNAMFMAIQKDENTISELSEFDNVNVSKNGYNITIIFGDFTEMNLYGLAIVICVIMLILCCFCCGKYDNKEKKRESLPSI